MSYLERGLRVFRKWTSPKGYFSQYGQDIVIERFFRKHPPRFRRFVEVGAFDGVTFSNVRQLALAGWSGISVEPVPENFAKLRDSYKGMPVACVNCACGSKDGSATLHVSTSRSAPGGGTTSASEWR